MAYRYRKYQIFRKKLNVSSMIQNKIYNQNLSYEEFIKYDLVDKIPLSCLDEFDRSIVEKVGLERAKTIDWELLRNMTVRSYISLNMDKIDFNSNDINGQFDALVLDQIDPQNYSTRLQSLYPNKVVISDNFILSQKFYSGNLLFNEIVSNWDIFKGKDLSKSLKNDPDNKYNITSENLNKFMDKYGTVVFLVNDARKIYQLISELYMSNLTDVMRDNVIKEFVDSNTLKGHWTHDDYVNYFKIVDFKEYISDKCDFNKVFGNMTFEEIEALPIPLDILLNSNVLELIGIYGLDNIISFDNDNNHFFTRNDCKVLKEMYIAYLQYDYSGEFHNKQAENEGRQYTKEEFYEIIRRMIVYGPKNFDFFNNSMDYRYINGPFRQQNSELFISDKLPKEVQKAFYTKQITPLFIKKYPYLVEELQGKNLEACFKNKDVYVRGSDGECYFQSVYQFLVNQIGYEQAMLIIFDYADYWDKMFDNYYDMDSKIIFDVNDSYNQIVGKIDLRAYNLIRNMNIKYNDSMPNRFKSKYSNLFLDDDVPDIVKNLFYNKSLNLTLIHENPNWLKYFNNKELLYGFDESFSDCIGLFDTQNFLKFIDLCGEDIKYETNLLQFLHSANHELSMDETAELIYQYFCQFNKGIKYIMILNNFKYDNPEFITIYNRLCELIKHRPELDPNNPAFSFNLLDENLINTYGYEIISDILEYNSGASEVLIRANMNKDFLLKKWIDYVKKLPTYDKKMLHFALLSYENSKMLIYEIVGNNAVLNDEQLNNLHEILTQRNNFGVQNIEDLTSYQHFRKTVLEERLNTDKLEDIQDTILQILFNTSLFETKKIFHDFGLDSKEHIKYNLVADHIITVEEEATIEIIREILSESSSEKLKFRFNQIVDKGTISNSLIGLQQKLKQYYGQKFKGCLYKSDGQPHEGISYSDVDGQDFDMLDINGQKMTSTKKIQVVNLEGAEFKLLIHKIHNYDPNLASLSNKIIEDPSMWNKLEGASTLSTSMISDTHLRCVHGRSGENTVYYGFNDISSNSLMLMGRRDIFVEHGGRKLEPTSHLNEYMLPDLLQHLSNNYNEVALDRKSSNYEQFDHRLEPSCIICFNGVINDESKKAAQYFNIPIYMIHSSVYESRNQSYSEQCEQGQITVSSIKDVRKLLYRKKAMSENYDLLLKCVDKSLIDGIIDVDTYHSLLIETRKIIASYSSHSSMDGIELSEITKRLTNITKKDTDEEEKGWNK